MATPPLLGRLYTMGSLDTDDAGFGFAVKNRLFAATLTAVDLSLIHIYVGDGLRPHRDDRAGAHGRERGDRGGLAGVVVEVRGAGPGDPVAVDRHEPGGLR